MKLIYWTVYAIAGLMRPVVLMFLTLVYFIPAFFASMHGHGRFGKTGVFDTLDLDKPFAPFIWAAVLIWIVWPLLRAFYDCVKGE